MTNIASAELPFSVLEAQTDLFQQSDVSAVLTEAHNLLHGGETVGSDDAGYQGVHKRQENLGLEVEWRVAM